MAYTRTYDIPYFLVDLRRNLRISALMQYFEDMAIRHSEDCGVGLDYYEQKEVAWVLAKWDVTVHHYPKFNEIITITTEPVSFRNFFGFRRFNVQNQKKTVLAEANTLWIFVDMRRKKPVPVTDEVIKAYGLSRDQNRPLSIRSPEAPETGQFKNTFRIRPGDIDTNHHVNNTRYVEWALDTLPVEETGDKLIRNVWVDYRKELTSGDDIQSIADIREEEESLISRHRIGNGEKDACALTFRWVPFSFPVQ